jgi:cobalt-zinc-cadmium efflux system outer membrane protein
MCLTLIVFLATSFAGGQTSDPASTPITFDQAQELVVTRNLQVQAAQRQRAIREAAIRAARQIPNPDVSFETTRDVPHQVLNFDFPVEMGGRRARRIDVAREELGLAEIDVRAGLRLVRRELRQAFFSLLAADERVHLAESELEIARRVRDAAQARFETGAAPRLEVLQSDLGVTRAETELDLAVGSRAAAQAGLGTVLNFPPQQALSITGAMAEHTATPTYDVALAIATTSNVDLMTLDREIAIEQSRTGLLRAERVPTPVFTLGGVFNAPGEFDAGARAAVSVGLPIFNRNQGEIAASIATTSQLRSEREATIRGVENGVFAALTRIDAERRQVAAYHGRLVPTATELESLAEESYRAGRTSVLAVLEAQRSLRQLRADALQAELDLQFAVAELEEILGTALP